MRTHAGTLTQAMGPCTGTNRWLTTTGNGEEHCCCRLLAPSPTHHCRSPGRRPVWRPASAQRSCATPSGCGTWPERSAPGGRRGWHDNVVLGRACAPMPWRTGAQAPLSRPCAGTRARLRVSLQREAHAARAARLEQHAGLHHGRVDDAVAVKEARVEGDRHERAFAAVDGAQYQLQRGAGAGGL